MVSRRYGVKTSISSLTVLETSVFSTAVIILHYDSTLAPTSCDVHGHIADSCAETEVTARTAGCVLAWIQTAVFQCGFRPSCFSVDSDHFQSVMTQKGSHLKRRT